MLLWSSESPSSLAEQSIPSERMPRMRPFLSLRVRGTAEPASTTRAPGSATATLRPTSTCGPPVTTVSRVQSTSTSTTTSRSALGCGVRCVRSPTEMRGHGPVASRLSACCGTMARDREHGRTPFAAGASRSSSLSALEPYTHPDERSRKSVTRRLCRGVRLPGGLQSVGGSPSALSRSPGSALDPGG